MRAHFDVNCVGKDVQNSTNDEIDYAGLAEQVQGESFPLENNSYRIVQYEPIGVCAGIAVWNFTFVFLAWKIAPAVAAGNTVRRRNSTKRMKDLQAKQCIFKPSEKSPFAMLAVAPLFAEAGFPPGVINFVCGDGSTGALLASHMDIDKIAFTGSTAVGRAVQVAAAKSNLKKVTLELGGKSPAVIFEDADIQNAVANFAQGLLFNSGQVCFTTSRLLLHESIADTFIQALKQAFDGAAGAMGDQMKEETQLGPLVDRKQFERVLGFLESGKSEAELVVGGARKGDKGCFVQPTIFLNPKENAKIYREEIFGPVVAATVFDTEEEAINMANDSAFGLSGKLCQVHFMKGSKKHLACIYTENMSRALRVSRKIRAGTIAINSSFLPDNNTPFGGYKQSGYGRESGMEGLKAYLQAKTIKIAVKPS